MATVAHLPDATTALPSLKAPLDPTASVAFAAPAMSFNPLPSSQQPWAPPPPAPPARSGTTRVLVFGCLGLVMLTVLGVAASVFLLGTKLVGSSLASTPVTPGAPTSVSFTDPGKGATGVWLDVDVAHARGFRVRGELSVTAGARSLGQYEIDGDLGGRCTNPVIGQGSSHCIQWNSTRLGAGGRVSGRTRLFEIPAQPRGTTVTIEGTISIPGDVTPRRLVLDVRD